MISWRRRRATLSGRSSAPSCGWIATALIHQDRGRPGVAGDIATDRNHVGETREKRPLLGGAQAGTGVPNAKVDTSLHMPATKDVAPSKTKGWVPITGCDGQLVEFCSDSDLACDATSRRSTSGGALLIMGAMIGSFLSRRLRREIVFGSTPGQAS